MIDWSRVDELVDEIGAEDFGEVVELFLDEVETAIGQLEACAANPVVTEEQMHFLKGAALNIGFATLAKLCQTGEKSAAEGKPETVSPQEVRDCYEASRAQFQQDLPGRLAA
ncbi:Hpt domain-containing protein [Maliponia aquimaris]|uniref:Hpt domain protein n=1 Tax=Maliponia aquimaris TaxID=1673631 RepID=A0A238JRQ0_9RHOB|nr:Hpt domain-containing protein [Maliponia aquimaris]SMX32416.1 Hpt domain protein [Maliponia aquimaris]